MLNAFSTNIYVLNIEKTFLGLAYIISSRKHSPESQRFIACPCYDCTSIWTHGQVKNSECMPCQSWYLLHFWILPNIDLIQRKSMSWNKFVQSFAENQIANLWTSVNWSYCCSLQSVSELYGFISCTSSWKKKAMLMRWPSYSLNCSHMIAVFHDRLIWLQIPNV